MELEKKQSLRTILYMTIVFFCLQLAMLAITVYVFFGALIRERVNIADHFVKLTEEELEDISGRIKFYSSHLEKMIYDRRFNSNEAWKVPKLSKIQTQAKLEAKTIQSLEIQNEKIGHCWCWQILRYQTAQMAFFIFILMTNLRRAVCSFIHQHPTSSMRTMRCWI
eukprot:TRINITY_DN11738_c0_g5_i1.p1 TRINITY_DN11738_c0_g5~~TRINITY_DN11738_c0_g5_i1.p1  ORF type:complete len:166 (-),score=15.15 TRINITY_DN11738_c0_g5_i1:103-600(-)